MSVMVNALEFYARSFLGQLDLWHVKTEEGKLLDYGARADVENRLKEHMGLTPSASFGIYQEFVDDKARIAFDMMRVLRHQQWLDTDTSKKETYDISGDIPRRTAKEPLITVN